MIKTLAFLVSIGVALTCSAQTFEPERGGVYFFSPIKDGFISMSTVGLNIGIGEYISSGNTVSTYYLDGSKKGSSTIDCRDGLTAGFANENNNFSYLSSAFYNTKNSFYKMVLYLANAEADLERETINLKSLFGRELGRGKYILDLNYGLATSDSFVFAFSKYSNDSLSYFVVKVNNKDRKAEILPLFINSSDNAIKNGEESRLQFVYDGNSSLSAVQMVKAKGVHAVRINTVDLDSLMLIDNREVYLPILGTEMKVFQSAENDLISTVYSQLPSILDRGFESAPNWARFDMFQEKILMSGLYSDTEKSSASKQKADGIFEVTIGKNDSTISTFSSKIPFQYEDRDVIRPDYASLSTRDKRYYSLFYETTGKVVVFKGGQRLVYDMLKNGSGAHGLIKALDTTKVIDKKYLKVNRSKIYRSQLGVFCLYDLKSNSVGSYTRLTFQRF